MNQLTWDYILPSVAKNTVVDKFRNHYINYNNLPYLRDSCYRQAFSVMFSVVVWSIYAKMLFKIFLFFIFPVRKLL